MSRSDLVPRVIVQSGSLPAGGANTGALIRFGNHVYFDDGTALWQLDQQQIGTATSYTINLQAASYTLAIGDGKNTLVVMNSSSPTNVTIPPNSLVAFPVGCAIQINRYGAGGVTIVAGAGVTVVGPSLALRAQYSTVALVQVSANTWEAIGDTTVTLAAPSYLTVGASPFTYQNTGTREVDIYSEPGGGVSLTSTFSRDNITYYNILGAGTSLIRLSPGDYLKATYVGGTITMLLIPR